MWQDKGVRIRITGAGEQINIHTYFMHYLFLLCSYFVLKWFVFRESAKEVGYALLCAGWPAQGRFFRYSFKLNDSGYGYGVGRRQRRPLGAGAGTGGLWSEQVRWQWSWGEATNNPLNSAQIKECLIDFINAFFQYQNNDCDHENNCQEFDTVKGHFYLLA